MLEGSVLQWYQEDTGFEVRRHELQLEVSADIPWLAASRDATAVTPYKDRRNVEVKTARSRHGNRGDEEAETWGEAGSDEVPRPYIIQTHVQMAVGGFDLTDLPALIGMDDFRVYSIPRSVQLLDGMLRRLAEFWEHVRAGTPPAMDFGHRATLELVQQMYRTVSAEEIEIEPDYLVFAKALQTARSSKAAYEKVGNEMKARLLARMGGAEYARITGSEVVVRRQLIVKNFKPKPAERREEIHLKIEGVEHDEAISVGEAAALRAPAAAIAGD
jgi:hypothetical protein